MKGHKHDGSGIDDAKSWECGTGKELGLRPYSMLDQEYLEAVYMQPTSMSWSRGWVNRGRCLGDLAAQREGCND